MTTEVLVADFEQMRRQQLKELLERVFEYKVDELITSPYNPSQNLDSSVLERIRRRKYDLLVAHTGGNPPGSECLKVFKDHNPRGKVILYTNRDKIELKEFDDLKRVNKLFRRSDNDSLLFDNESEMLDVIKAVMNEPGLVFWKNPFKYKEVQGVIVVFTVLFTFLTAIVKFGGELISN